LARKAVSKKTTSKKTAAKKTAAKRAASKTARSKTVGSKTTRKPPTERAAPRKKAAATWRDRLSARRAAILEHIDGIADRRDHWRRRNEAFYADDLAFMRFLVPEGARVMDLGCGTGALLEGLKPSLGVGIDFSANMVDAARSAYPETEYPELQFRVGDVERLSDLTPSLLEEFGGPFDVIILSDTLGFLDDCQATLDQLHDLCDEETRIIISYYSSLWEPMLRLGETVGLKMPQPEVNFLGPADISNILSLADFDVIKTEWRQIVPARLLGLGTLINRYIGTLPLIRALSLRHYVVARSLRKAKRKDLSTTVLVPCRNEKGNIESAITRLPRFCKDMEVLYVEGNSSDGTFEECERVRDHYGKPENGGWDIKVFKQPGKGKGDAVRKGFDEARGDILMILDADLTMPPEELPKFYDAIAGGKGEFINGSRLVYPMEKGAMRFLNYWANRTFALIFSFLLNQRFTDTLCGTKVLTKADYIKIQEGRSYFGDFDPFGDFDLIFGAAKRNLKIVEIPMRYADRTYGEPQISRFRDGWLLLKMVVFAWRKLKAF
jgi:SAM-dependent methyltransferase